MNAERAIVLAAPGAVVPSEGLAPVSTGASLTLVTVREAVSVAVLKAVAPPLAVVSTLAPLTPLVASQARYVIRAVSPFLPSGV